ncbi:MAG: hypothetical protein CVT92_07080 [Bacteroidetes bacterium HGW-Bacteroidetes-1]|jgi:hypothetical protein|nr:MAG: hypothetical protein CVT92_07080 [Bacteroidetes bacterium HGW-Bacteroidetes-1]
MQLKSNKILPLVGYGDLNFGQTVEELTSVLGEAEEIDHLDTDDQMNTIILHFWEEGLSVFFEGVSKTVISCFETDNPEATLFDKKVFELKKAEVIDLMKENGYSELEVEEEEGEIRVTFEDGLIDFFYDDELLLAVNWGVIIDENGDIEYD